LRSRAFLAIFVATALCAGAAAARSVQMIEKRQAANAGLPLESSRQVKLPDGRVAQLVTCCGLNQDDSALYTVRDKDGYTIVDHKFSSGRYYLSDEGRLISVQKTGPSFTLTFQDTLLKIIKQLNMVNVHSLVIGDKGSVAVLTGPAEGAWLRIYGPEGQVRWELKNAPAGALSMLPKETHVAVTAGGKLTLYPLAGGEPLTLDAGGAVQLIGVDPVQGALFVSVDLPGGGEVWSLDQATFTPRWKHRLADTPAGHCQSMVVELSRYLPSQHLIALLLRCPGERQMFYVARFLSDAGETIGQEKLGRRIETSFHEMGNKIAILSDGFLYTFAVHD
jgi:hypothetical protein